MLLFNQKHLKYVWLAVMMIAKEINPWLEEQDSEFAMPLE
jgi:hypothetical protein